jgi:hypothetical protein
MKGISRAPRRARPGCSLDESTRRMACTTPRSPTFRNLELPKAMRVEDEHAIVSDAIFEVIHHGSQMHGTSFVVMLRPIE